MPIWQLTRASKASITIGPKISERPAARTNNQPLTTKHQMNPDDVVLVALMNTPRDLELATQEHWYRIPAKHAPKFFSGADYLAFYLPSAFRERKWTIDTYATVRGHELVRRVDLIPE